MGSINGQMLGDGTVTAIKLVAGIVEDITVQVVENVGEELQQYEINAAASAQSASNSSTIANNAMNTVISLESSVQEAKESVDESVVQTEENKNQTALDVIQTGLDRISAENSALLAEQYKNEIQEKVYNDTYES